MKDPQQARSLKRKIAKTAAAEYLIYLPKDYHARAKTRWPLVLFLHGAGERGANLSKVAVHGPPKLAKQGRDFPFILVSPQSPGRGWDPNVLNALPDSIIEEYHVDKDRVYLTGLSMGGFGTWSVGIKNPGRFAAIAPICGGGSATDVRRSSRGETKAAFTSLGVWAFHGAKDPTVKLEESETMVAALKAAGATDVQLTIYPEAKHDSWTETYNNAELYAWFLKHSR